MGVPKKHNAHAFTGFVVSYKYFSETEKVYDYVLMGGLVGTQNMDFKGL